MKIYLTLFDPEELIIKRNITLINHYSFIDYFTDNECYFEDDEDDYLDLDYEDLEELLGF